MPPSLLDTCIAWSEGASKSQTAFDIPLNDPFMITSKPKPAKGTFSAQDRVLLKAESPTLAALGDSLYAELKKVVKEEDTKLHRIINRDSRWEVQCTLLSRPEGTEEVKTLYAKLRDGFASTVGKDKVRVTGTWILNHTGGEKILMEFPFEG
jgi:hypothetical protein